MKLSRNCTTPDLFRSSLKQAAMLTALIASMLASGGADAEIRRIYQLNKTGVGRLDPFVCVDFKKQSEVECPDIVMVMDAWSHNVSQPYKAAQFDTLESTFERWRPGGKQLGDGTWELAVFNHGLYNAFQTMTSETERLSAWKKQKPGSVAARYVEARMFYIHALRVKGDDPHTVHSSEAKAISAERLAKAAALLRKLKPHMRDSPAWYDTQIAVLVEQGSVAQARKVFNEAVKRFPQYHPLYLTMSAAYKGKAFEAFANEAVELTKQFEGRGLYARLYRHIEQWHELPIDLQQSRYPHWPQLKAGYEDLIERYPASIALATSFASVTCRTDDSELYRTLRSKASAYLDPASFSVIPVDACDQRHGWKDEEQQAAPTP